MSDNVIYIDAWKAKQQPTEQMTFVVSDYETEELTDIEKQQDIENEFLTGMIIW